MIEISELENAVILQGYWPDAKLVVNKEDISNLIKALAEYVKDDADQSYDTSKPQHNWAYLGDGVYACFDGYHVVLGVSNGGPVNKTIYLDEHVYDNLIWFCNNQARRA